MRSLVTQPPIAGGSSQPPNPNMTFENLGYSADGSPTTVQSGASNTKGSYISIGTTTNALCGFVVEVFGTNQRLLYDLRIGGATVVLPNVPVWINTGVVRQFFPIAVPAATLIEVRNQASAATQNNMFGIRGIVASSSLPPGYSAAEAIIAADTAGTRPSATDVPFSSSGPTWTQLNAATSRAYGAVWATAQQNATTPGAAQDVTVVLGVGAAASEAEYGRILSYIFNSSGGLPNCQQLFEKAMASGVRVSAGVLATTPGSDNARVYALGFY